MNYRRILFLLALIGYLCITTLAVFHIAHMQESGEPMENCPFAFGEHALCGMSANEHIIALRGFSNILPSVFEWLTLIATTCVFFVAPFLTLTNSNRIGRHKRKKTTIVSLYSQLFSDGLLNPRIP